MLSIAKGLLRQRRQNKGNRILIKIYGRVFITHEKNVNSVDQKVTKNVNTLKVTYIFKVFGAQSCLMVA